MPHCGSGQKDHETWARKQLIAAAQTITPSVNAEAALLLAGEGTTSARKQKQMPTQVLEARPIYTGPEHFPASLMKQSCALPTFENWGNHAQAGDAPHRPSLGQGGREVCCQGDTGNRDRDAAGARKTEQP